MTEGISKEKLIEYRSLRLDAEELLDRIIDDCTELDPWLPIDENTPQDRNLLLGRLDGFKAVGHYLNYGYWVDHGQNYIIVTHYKLLPEDPK